jgi:hypothetical protein
MLDIHGIQQIVRNLKGDKLHEYLLISIPLGTSSYATAAFASAGGGIAILSFSAFFAWSAPLLIEVVGLAGSCAASLLGVAVFDATVFFGCALASAAAAGVSVLGFFFFFSRPDISLQPTGTNNAGLKSIPIGLTCADCRPNVILDFPTLLKESIILEFMLFLCNLLQVQLG